MKDGEKKKIKWSTAIIIILLVIILSAGGYLGYMYYMNNPQVVAEVEKEEPVVEKVVEEVKTVQIYKGTERPIAVMIDNNKDAFPQGGLNEAYAVYEIIVEGGDTRLMAVFKSPEKVPEMIGPVRSSRHYFLDYAMENDAIYAHFGWSPQAEYDIRALNINNVNGLIESSETFWRTKDKQAPHNAVTTLAKIKAVAENRKYRLTSEKESVLNYVTHEVELLDGIPAETITIPYNGKYNITKYEYNPETKRYQRFCKGVEEVDWTTKEPTTTKNIIITFVKNYTLNDSENKGRQGLNNIGTFDGYYITNGRAIKITCEKTARDSQTKYIDIYGNSIEVNDGNTYFQIVPIDANVTIEGTEDVPVTTEETNTVENN